MVCATLRQRDILCFNNHSCSGANAKNQVIFILCLLVASYLLARELNYFFQSIILTLYYNFCLCTELWLPTFFYRVHISCLYIFYWIFFTAIIERIPSLEHYQGTARSFDREGSSNFKSKYTSIVFIFLDSEWKVTVGLNKDNISISKLYESTKKLLYAFKRGYGQITNTYFSKHNIDHLTQSKEILLSVRLRTQLEVIG